jgi:hypothetical protein
MDFTITNVAASFVLRITTGIMNGKHLLIFCDLQTKQSHVGFRGRAIGCGQRLKRAMASSIDSVATYTVYMYSTNRPCATSEDREV